VIGAMSEGWLGECQLLGAEAHAELVSILTIAMDDQGRAEELGMP
jgi:hypothetical protein